MTSSLEQQQEAYLLVMGEGAARQIPLLGNGAHVIGRSPRADITIDDSSLVDSHAIIDSSESGFMIRPAEGDVFVNDDPIDENQKICSGDLLRLGSVLLGFHGITSRSRDSSTLSPEQMRRRLVEETERFLRYRRPLALMVIRGKPSTAAKEEALIKAVSKAVRVVDVVAWNGKNELWILFPETSDTAMIPAERVLSAACKALTGACAGLARCPTDGIDPNGLLAGARAAAKEAPSGKVVLVTNANHSLHVGDHRIVAADPLMRSLFELIRRIAASEIPVLIMGETGSGKEIVAQAVHAWSKRKDKRMVSINCAAMTETLLESELFGHEKGAFTGATSTKMGLFEEATGGTVFLDEIGECSPRTQAELLRVLETKRFCRVGSLRERVTDVRIVAATNRPLEEEIREGRFRQDLYFRLNTATVTVPPLRDRPLDLPVLARAFLEEGCKRESRASMRLSSDAMQRIALHHWPGNIRELRNLMDFLTATVRGEAIEATDLPPSVAAKAAPWMLPRLSQPISQTPRVSPSTGVLGQKKQKEFRNLYEEIRELEILRISEALEEAEGVRNRAAELIGMPLRTLVTKIKVYGLGPAPTRSRSRRSRNSSG